MRLLSPHLVKPLHTVNDLVIVDDNEPIGYVRLTTRLGDPDKVYLLLFRGYCHCTKYFFLFFLLSI